MSAPARAQTTCETETDLTDRIEVWSGTVTVGNRVVFYGFNADGLGMLSDTEFNLGSITHTIDVLAVVGGRTLIFGLDGRLSNAAKDTLRLHVCDTTRNLIDSRVNSSSDYSWSNVSLNWAIETSIVAAVSAPAPTISIADASAIEGAAVEFAATLSERTAYDVTVNYAASAESGDTAVADTDFTTASGTVTIAEGETEATFSVPTTGDTLDEDDETFTVTLTSSSLGFEDSEVAATGTIEDNDDQPTFLGSDPTAPEAAGNVEITVTIPASGKTVSMNWTTANGTATAGQDYTAANGALTFSPGTTDQTLRVTIADDTADEPDEDFRIAFSNPSNITAQDVSYTVTIIDDDPTPTAKLTLDPMSIPENGGTTTVSTVTATLDGPSSQATAIEVSASPRLPAVADDFTLSTNKTLTIAAGSTTSTGTVTIRANDNSVAAADKTITVSGSATNSQGVIRPDDVELTITEDDSAATMVTLSLDKTAIGEGETGASARTFTVKATLDRVRGQATDVTVSIAGGTAAAMDDFTLIEDLVITIPATMTSATGTFMLAPVDDTLDERNETLTVTGSTTDSSLTVLPADGLTVTITDNDATPKVTLVLTPDNIPEKDGKSTVTATLDGQSSLNTTVTVAATGASANHFTLTGHELTIAAGTTTSTGDVTIAATDDAVAGGDKTVTVSATATNDVGVTAPDSKTLTITDDETASTGVTLTVLPSSVAEDVGTTGQQVTVTATLDGAAGVDPTIVSVTVSDGTAQGGTDFTVVPSFHITIAASATSGTHTFSLIPIDDDVDEPDETLTLGGSAGSLTVDSATLTITDDEDPPTVTLVLTPEKIPEKDGKSTVTATLDRASSEQTRVTVAAAAVSPAVADDFILSQDKILTIAAKSKTSTGTVTVTARDNPVDTPDKSIAVSGTAANDLPGIVQPAQVTLTITDDEVTSTGVNLTLSETSVPEGGGGLQVTVTATLNGGARPEATTFTIAVGGGTATDGTDFATVNDFMLTIDAADARGEASFTLTPTNDNVDEPHETVTVSATTGSDLDISPPDLSVTITDDDDTPQVTLATGQSSIGEAGGSTDVRASLDHPSSRETTITVDSAPAPRTPTKDTDFTQTGTMITIDAGQTTSTDTVTVTAQDNGVYETGKRIVITAVADNTFAIDQPVLIDLDITEDDSQSTELQLSLSPTELSEGATGAAREVTVTAMLDNAARPEPTQVTVAVAAGTAVLNVDFSPVSPATFSIPEGQTSATGTVTVVPIDDMTDEPDKTVQVRGTTTASGLTVTPAAGLTLTIADNDDTPKVTLELSPPSIPESEMTSTVTATLNHPSSEATTVTVSAAAAGNAAATDFELSDDKVLTIDAGQTASSGTVTIGTVDNIIAESGKSVTVSATADNTQGVTAPDDATLTITDDESPSTAVTLTVSPTSVAENVGAAGRQITVTATLDGAAGPDDRTVAVSVGSGTADSGTDFPIVNGFNLTIAAEATTGEANFTLFPVDDRMDEPDTETVSVSGTLTGLTVNPATVAITDDDPAPAVTLILSSQSIGENGDSATVTAELDRPSSMETTVDIAVAAATPAVDTDFEQTGVTLTIAAGQTTSSGGTVEVTAVNNIVYETGKTLSVSGSATNDLGVEQPGPALTLAIDEDDTASRTVTVSLSRQSVSEGATGASREVTVTAALDDAARPDAVDVAVSVRDGTAAAGTDYSAVTDFTVPIEAGATQGTATFELIPLPDETDEPDRTVQVRASVPAGSRLSVEPAGGNTVTITDDDDAPQVTLSLSPASLLEQSEDSSTLTATLDHPSSEQTRIEITAAPLEGARVEDYRLNGRTLTIPVGETSSTGTVTLTAVRVGDENFWAEGDRQVEVIGVATNSQGIMQPEAAHLEITDAQVPSTTLTLIVYGRFGYAEGSRDVFVDFGYTLDAAPRPPGDDLLVTVTATGDTATAGEDFVDFPGITFRLPGTQSYQREFFSMDFLDDDLHEGEETLTISATLTDGHGDPVALMVVPFTIFLYDNESAPTVTLVLTPPSVPEDGGVSTVTAELDYPSSKETTVTVTAAAMPPATADDFQLDGSTLTIAPGAKRSSGTVTVTGVDNTAVGATRVTVSGTAKNDLAVVQPRAGILTITDDETASTAVTLRVSPARVAEDATGSARIVTVTGTLDGATRATATTIVLTVAGGSAAATDDFAPVEDVTLTIPANIASDSTSFTLAPQDDNTDEPDETVRITAPSSANGLTVVPSGGLEVVIEDNDATPRVTLVLDPASISETNGSTTVTAELDRPSSERTSVTVSATAVQPATVDDYRLSGGPLIIAPGETTSTGTVTIRTNADDVSTGDLSVTVSGVADNGLGVVQPPPQALTIADDDVESTRLTLTLSPNEVREDRAARVTVTAMLNAASRSVATEMRVSVEDGTAVAGTDFAAVTDFTFEIPAGERSGSGSFMLTPLNDDVSEPHRTVKVRVEKTDFVSHLSVETDPEEGLEVTILDDEPAPVAKLVLSPPSVREDGGVSTVTAELDRPSSAATEVTVTAVAVSPAVADDFQLDGATLRIAPGETTSTGTVTITGVDNETADGTKRVTVSGVAENAERVDHLSDVTLSITDNDSASTAITLSVSPEGVPEGVGASGWTVTVTAELDGAARAQDTEVAVTVSAGTASLNTDFAPVNNLTVTIRADAKSGSATFTLVPVDDDIDEPDETVRVRGPSRASGLRVEPSGGIEVTIEDDDAEPAVTLALDPASISETGETSTVTATLDHPSSVQTEVTVSTAPVHPAQTSDYRQSGTRLTIPVGETQSTGRVTITSVGNETADGLRQVTVSGAADNSLGVVQPRSQTLDIEDDDFPSTKVTLTVSPAEVREGRDSRVTVTATLDGAPRPETAEVTVSVVDGTAAAGTDYTAVADFPLTILADRRSGSASFMLATIDNPVSEPHRTVEVRGTTNSGLLVETDPVEGLEVTILDDEPAPVAKLVLSPPSVREDGGVSTVTAELDRPSSAATEVTVTAVAVSPAVADDFQLDGATLRIAPGETTSTGTVTITGVDNETADGTKRVTVSGVAENAERVDHPSDVTLSITDNDSASTAITLSVSPEGVPEGVGASGRTVTVTAELDGAARAQDTEVAVTVSAGTASLNTDFAPVNNLTVTIRADAKSGSATFTLVPVDDDIDEPDETVRVRGPSRASGLRVEPSGGIEVTIEDDDAEPAVTLALDPASISETGETSTVTATLDHPSSVQTEVTVSTAPVHPAQTSDYRQSGTRLTIPVGETQSTGRVTITSVGNETADGLRQVTVSGAADNSLGVVQPRSQTLDIEDDDFPSTKVTLTVSPAEVREGRDSRVTVTATLDGAPRPETAEVTVSVVDGTAAAGTDYTAVADFPLTILADRRSGSASFMLATIDNPVSEPHRTVEVRGTTNSGLLVETDPVEGLEVTILDDEPAPVAKLVLSPPSVREDGGVSTVTAELDRPSSAATEVTVTAVAVSPAVADDFQLDGATLRIAPGETTSTGTVTITGVDNETADGTKRVTVSGVAENAERVDHPSDVTLSITDNDSASTAITLSVSPEGVPEGVGASGWTVTVTAELDGAARAQDTEVAVTVSAGTASLNTDFAPVNNLTVTIRADAKSGSATFTLVPVDDDIDEPDETVRVRGPSRASGLRVEPSGGIEVTIEDDDAEPAVTLALDPASISETGETSTVTATLDHPSSVQTEVTVSTAPVHPAQTSDYRQSGTRLTIPVGETQSTGRVTITSVGNETADGLRQVTVSGAADNSLGVVQPRSQTLDIEDDDFPSTKVTLTVSPAEVREGRDSRVTVTATLDGAPRPETAEVTVSVVDGTAAAGTDYTAVADFPLTILADRRSGSASFMLATIDNPVSEPHRTVEVRGTTNSGLLVETDPVEGLEVTILDDEPAPVAKLVLSPPSVREDGGVSTVTAELDRPSSAATEVTVTAVAVSPAVADDFQLDGATLRIAPGETTSTGTVTITGVDNETADGTKRVTVSGVAENAERVDHPSDVTLSITDNDSASTAITLSVSPEGVPEGVGASGRTVTVTAELDGAARAQDTEVTVTVSAGTASLNTDFAPVNNLTVTIRADAKSGSATFTLVPVDDDIDEPDETVRVRGPSRASGLRVEPSGGIEVTIEDDDAEPAVTLALDPASISETGETSTVTATLDHPSSVQTEVTVSTAPVHPAQTSDYRQSGTRLTIPVGETQSTGRVTITSVGNETADGLRQVTVSGAADNSLGVVQPRSQTLDIEDDDFPSTKVTLTVSPAEVREGTSARVTLSAALDGAPRADAVDVAVSSVAGGTAMAGTDYAAFGTVTVTIPAGRRSATSTFTLTTVDNAADTPHRTVRLGATTASGLPIEPASGIELTLLDDDGPAVPGTPPAPTVASLSSTELAVFWQAPGDNGEPVVRYELQYRAAGSSQWTAGAGAAAGRTSARIEGLEAATDYQVAVRAVNARGPGPWSAPAPGVVVSVAAQEEHVTEGAVLRFTITATPAPASALRVLLAVTETVDALSGAAPASLTIPGGEGSAVLELQSEDDKADESRSVVTVRVRSSPNYRIEGASASMSVDDNDNDKARGQALNPRAEAIPKPGIPQDLVSEPVLVLRFAWDAPADTTLSQVRAWRVGIAPAASCAGPAPETWPEHVQTVGGVLEYISNRQEPAAWFRVVALFEGTGRGAWSVPVCADTADYVAPPGPGAQAGPTVSGPPVLVLPRHTGGVWQDGDVIEAVVSFSAPVTVDTSGGMPTLEFLLNSHGRSAVYAGGSGTRALTFRYEISALHDVRPSWARPLGDGLKLNGATIRDASGVDAVLGFGAAPVVTALAVVPDRNADGRWSRGEMVTLTVDFNAPVTVNTPGGTPSIALFVGSKAREAVFSGGSKTARLTFTYPMRAVDGRVTVVRVPANALTLNGGAIIGVSGLPAVLSHEATSRTGTPDGGPTSVDDTGLPPDVRIADAKVREAPGAVLSFAVTLDWAPVSTVTVDWRTRDGSAKAGQDYVAARGTLRFAPGERSKTIAVRVLDDAHDEGEEVMLLHLTDVSGGTFTNVSGRTIPSLVAIGTIVNSDRLQRAWLARFGRTVAGQVLDAVESRLGASPQAGFEARLLGQGGTGGAPPHEAMRDAEAQARQAAFSDWLRGSVEEDASRRLRSRRVTPRELLTGSAFSLTAGSAETGHGAVWGRGAVTRFDGREDDLSLDGEVASGMLGVDGWRGPVAAGLIVAHSRGEGRYRMPGVNDEVVSAGTNGAIESTLTGLYPWGRYALSERVLVWGAAGYGAGTLALTPDGEDAKPIETDIDLMMAAAGLRGVLVQAPAEGGVELAVKTDAMGVRTTSAAVRGGADGSGNLAAAEAQVTQLRLGLEGTWRGMTLASGEMTSRLEAGLRLDSGDAETGFGLDLGGGLRWSDRESGVSLEVSGRGLLTHEAGGFRDRGLAVALVYAPLPESARGVRLTLRQTVGASATGGMDGFLARDTVARIAANDDDELQRRRLELKLGYGLSAFGDRFTATPEIRLGLSDSGRDYSVGGRLKLAQSGPTSLALKLEATRRENADDNAAEHGIGFGLTARW